MNKRIKKQSENQVVSVVIGNTCKQHNNEQHRWSFFVRCEKEVISKVIIQLHPTFNPSEVILTQPPFEIVRYGWGVFTITAQVHTIDDQVHTFTHLLEFDHTKPTKRTYELSINDYYTYVNMDTINNKILISSDEINKIVVLLPENSPTTYLTLNSPPFLIEGPFGKYKMIITFNNGDRLEYYYNKGGKKSVRVRRTLGYKVVDFPLDCLGEILRFVDDYKVFLKVYSVSSYTKYYVDVIDTRCAENVWFRLVGKVEGCRGYVVKLDVSVASDVDMEMFPNVRCIRVSRYDKEIKLGGIENIELKLDNKLKCLNVNYKSNKALLIDWNDSDTLIANDSCFGKNLKKLEIIGSVYKLKVNHFVNLEQLKYLKLTKCHSLNNSLFKFIPNITKLTLVECSLITLEGLKECKNLETLIVKNCESIYNLNGLSNNIEKQFEAHRPPFNADMCVETCMPNYPIMTELDISQIPELADQNRQKRL